MNAEKIREIRKQITPDLEELLRKIQESPHTKSLLYLLLSTDLGARLFVNGAAEDFVQIPGWLEAGYNCTNDADIVAYALAEALDWGEA
ncbi:hypothetical protein D4S03_05510 [bacterium]|nr:MAG: hypothetical protein D4S03_05510 [bacterium]